MRHILIGAADANITPTEEQYEQAKAKAEELLAQWEAGDATEDSFAQLAQENSADTSSASNGGLLQYVSPYSGYVDTFTQWSLDPSRQPGDTGIIQNTGSSVKGYHIMYFAGWDDPVWAVSAKKRPEQRAVQPVGRKTGQCLHCHPGQRSEICGVILPINTSGARCFKHRAPLSLFFPMLRLFVKLPEGQIHVHISLDPGHRGGVGVLPQVEVVEEAGAGVILRQPESIVGEPVQLVGQITQVLVKVDHRVVARLPDHITEGPRRSV